MRQAPVSNYLYGLYLGQIIKCFCMKSKVQVYSHFKMILFCHKNLCQRKRNGPCSCQFETPLAFLWHYWGAITYEQKVVYPLKEEKCHLNKSRLCQSKWWKYTCTYIQTHYKWLHRMFLEHWNRQKILSNNWQHFFMSTWWVDCKKKKKKSRWLFLNPLYPFWDKSVNIFGIWY